MSDLLKFNISEILRGLSNRDFSTTELVESYLQQINKTKKLNMYLEITSEQALKTANESDHKYKNNTNNDRDGNSSGNGDSNSAFNTNCDIISKKKFMAAKGALPRS